MQKVSAPPTGSPKTNPPGLTRRGFLLTLATVVAPSGVRLPVGGGIPAVVGSIVEQKVAAVPLDGALAAALKTIVSNPDISFTAPRLLVAAVTRSIAAASELEAAELSEGTRLFRVSKQVTEVLGSLADSLGGRYAPADFGTEAQFNAVQLLLAKRDAVPRAVGSDPDSRNCFYDRAFYSGLHAADMDATEALLADHERERSAPIAAECAGNQAVFHLENLFAHRDSYLDFVAKCNQLQSLFPSAPGVTFLNRFLTSGLRGLLEDPLFITTRELWGRYETCIPGSPEAAAVEREMEMCGIPYDDSHKHRSEIPLTPNLDSLESKVWSPEGWYGPRSGLR